MITVFLPTEAGAVALSLTACRWTASGQPWEDNGPHPKLSLC